MRFFLGVFFMFILGNIYAGTPLSKRENTNSPLSKESEIYNLAVETQASLIRWKGSDLTRSHTGTIKIKRGNLVVDGERLVSGSFIIDMHTISNTDLPTQTLKDMIEDHLKGKDFFDVQKYSESVFTVLRVQPIIDKGQANYKITGNLKMKNVEKSVTFDTKVTIVNETVIAETLPFTINRTEWNIKQDSKNIFANLKDNMIKDDIELQIRIVAKAQ